MATNIKFDDANQVALPVPAGTLSGAPVRVGGLNGIALTNRALSTATPPEFGGGNVDGEATVKLNGAGVFSVAFALTPGAPVYIDATNTLTDVNTDDLYGYSLGTKDATLGDAVIRVSN